PSGQGADRGAALRGGARGRVPRERDAAPGPEGGLAHPGTTRAARIERAGGAVTQVLVAVATYEAVVRTGADGKDPGWQQNHTGQDDSYRLTRTRYLHASRGPSAIRCRSALPYTIFPSRVISIRGALYMDGSSWSSHCTARVSPSGLGGSARSS